MRMDPENHDKTFSTWSVQKNRPKEVFQEKSSWVLLSVKWKREAEFTPKMHHHLKPKFQNISGKHAPDPHRQGPDAYYSEISCLLLKTILTGLKF